MAYVLTSLSGNLISAASAGFAPTNSADVSAIASAYVESGVSSKQDTLTFAYDNDKISAINGSALAGQGGGGLVTAIGTSNSGITSLNNSGLVDTAALRSADYSSLYVQEPLYISASGDSSYIGISGDVGGIDSATCSAIASAYAESAASSKLDTTAQVVTATATQLYAFSAYLTSVNSTPISAARAGNAANASLANSAWYDGTGRLISALPDSATVSSIASSYAESAASSKLDESATADFYSTSNPSGFITGVDLSDYATTAYVDYAVSSKQDTLSFGYDADNKISSIDGSAMAGGGGGGGSTISTGEFLGYTVVSADNGVSVVGNSGVVSSSVSVPYTDTTWATNTISANSNKSQFRIYNFNRTAGNMDSLPTGNSVRIRVTAATPGQSVYTDDQIHLIVYTGTNSGSPIGNWQVQSANGYKSAMWDKTVTWNSTNQPNMLITAENFNTYAFSTTALYSAVGAGSSASESSYTADVLAAHPSYVSSVASAYAESAVSSKADSSALSSYALSADVSGTVDLVSTQSANWGGSALALSAGPGVKLEKSGNILVAGLDGAMINEETIAGIWNGKLVYQMLLSGTGQTPGISNIALPASLTGTSIESKWLDPSDSYILYGTVSNRLPMSWCLGDGRYGALNIVGSNVTMRSTDTGTNNCSAYFKVKYIKAEA